MNRESIKWLAIGIIAALPVLALAAAGTWFTFSWTPEQVDPIASGPPVEKRVGMDTRLEKEAEYFERLEVEPWLARYTLTSAEGDWYESLYSEEDFQGLESYLDERLASLKDGWDIREYSNVCTGLTIVQFGEDPDRMEATLERWRETSPESHHAWLVSGGFYRQLAWLWRGNGYSNTVADEGMAKFREYVVRSRECFERSYELNPMDAESSSNLLILARDMSLGRAARDEYLDRIMKIAPNHYHAWNNYWFSATPKWGGSWEELDAIVERTEALKEEYPMLGVIRLKALKEMRWTRDGYKDIFKDEEVQREIVEVYEELLERWPDKPLFHMNYAYYLYWYLRDYERATKHFDFVGDEYYRDSAWGTLRAYNGGRAQAYAMYGSSLEEAERFEYISLAYELAPNERFVSLKMGRFYQDLGDWEEAESYFRKSSELDPEYGIAYRALATQYLEQGLFAEAKAEAERGMKEEISPAERNRLIGIMVKARNELKANESSDE